MNAVPSSGMALFRLDQPSFQIFSEELQQEVEMTLLKKYGISQKKQATQKLPEFQSAP